MSSRSCRKASKSLGISTDNSPIRKAMRKANPTYPHEGEEEIDPAIQFHLREDSNGKLSFEVQPVVVRSEGSMVAAHRIDIPSLPRRCP